MSDATLDERPSAPVPRGVVSGAAAAANGAASEANGAAVKGSGSIGGVAVQDSSAEGFLAGLLAADHEREGDGGGWSQS